MTDPMPAIRTILGMPKPTTPTTDWEADTERLLDDAYHLHSGSMRDDKLAEAQVRATAWTADEIRKLGDLMKEALETIKERNK
jgi:hypothetical protein